MAKLECRICTTFVKTSNLLEQVDIYTDIVKKIKEAVDIEIITGNSILTSICRSCYSDLETVQEFRRKCIESNAYYGLTKERAIKSGQCDVDLKEEKHNVVPNPKLDEAITEYYDKEPAEYEEENIKSDILKIEDISPTKSPTKPKRKRVKKKPITREESLVNRKQREKDNVPIICDICGNVFHRRHVFALHLRRHAEIKSFECELCAYRFYTNSELKRHMRRHTGEKPYECQYCHRRFSDYGTHMKHERTHTNDRPFSCELCGKDFSCNFVLKNHMLVHTGERPFKCKVCDKSFGRQNTLTTHMKSIYHKQNMLKQKDEC